MRVCRHFNDFPDIKFDIPCPGNNYVIDAPGFNGKKKLAQEGCDKLKYARALASRLMKEMPIQYVGYFAVSCTCGSKVDSDKYTLGISINKDPTTGKPICKFFTPP
jgi:hypothetical protein